MWRNLVQRSSSRRILTRIGDRERRHAGLRSVHHAAAAAAAMLNHKVATTRVEAANAAVNHAGGASRTAHPPSHQAAISATGAFPRGFHTTASGLLVPASLGASSAAATTAATSSSSAKGLHHSSKDRSNAVGYDSTTLSSADQDTTVDPTAAQPTAATTKNAAGSPGTPPAPASGIITAPGLFVPGKSEAAAAQEDAERDPRMLDCILIRHGESEGNIAYNRSWEGDHSLYTGAFLKRHSSLWRLTDRGREQARITGEWLRAHTRSVRDENPAVAHLQTIYRYYVSEYIRAMETAALMELPESKWFVEVQLRERDWGTFGQSQRSMFALRFARRISMRWCALSDSRVV